MCGRFALMTDLSVITDAFDIHESICDYRPDPDIRPGRQIAAVVHDGINRIVSFRWGLIPSWAKDPSMGSRLINARAEALTEKPSFRDAFKKRRCLIVADGFYESRKEGNQKVPVFFRLKSGRPFGFAGLYETWTSPEGKPIATCTIITTEPNDLIRPIHHRMPVIVPKEKEPLWIDPAAQNASSLSPILQPYPPFEMEVAPKGFRPGIQDAVPFVPV